MGMEPVCLLQPRVRSSRPKRESVRVYLAVPGSAISSRVLRKISRSYRQRGVWLLRNLSTALRESRPNHSRNETTQLREAWSVMFCYLARKRYTEPKIRCSRVINSITRWVVLPFIAFRLSRSHLTMNLPRDTHAHAAAGDHLSTK